MKKLLMLVLLLGLLSMGCTSPTKEHVCPDGTIVSDESKCPDYNPDIINLDPDDFESIILEENKTCYVKSSGQITVFFEITGNEWIVLGNGKTTLYTNLTHENISKRPTWVEDNTYVLTINAPAEPGGYTAFAGRKTAYEWLEGREYNLTVIGEVSNESMAYAIADRFMRINTPYKKNYAFPYAGIPRSGKLISFLWGGTEYNWNTTSKEALLGDDGNWEVFMEASYDICGDDWDMDVCLRNNTITGHFIINKKTGQVIG